MKMSRNLLATAALVMSAIGFSGEAAARDTVRIVGSSTVYPFSIAVAERVGKMPGVSTPVVESTGSGGGLKLFCAGIGPDHPDVTNASRRIKKSEYEDCTQNGISILEIKLGYDGIVFANSRQSEKLSLTKEQIFLALAAKLPMDGKLIDNPYQTWNEIDPGLPNKKIEVLGPPPTSGTRDAFVELVMEEAAGEIAAVAALEESDPDLYKQVSQAIREDGAYVEAGENDNLIVQKLNSNPDAFGIFGFSFLDQNRDTLQGSLVEGVAPTFDNIATGEYSVSRPLYFYVKLDHVGQIPGIMTYVEEATSEKAASEDGYLADRGLIPLPEDEREDQAEKIENRQALTM